MTTSLPHIGIELEKKKDISTFRTKPLLAAVHELISGSNSPV